MKPLSTHKLVGLGILFLVVGSGNYIGCGGCAVLGIYRVHGLRFSCLRFIPLARKDVLHEQLIRASSSIALNLAEGSGKKKPIDQRRFYTKAFGSLRECQAILELEKIDNSELKKNGKSIRRDSLYIEQQNPTKNRTETASDIVTVTANQNPKLLNRRIRNNKLFKSN